MAWHSGERPNARKWQRVRLQVLERDGWRCTQCGRAGRVEVDHRVPMNEGGAMYAMDNLQTLCLADHHHKTTMERALLHPVTPEVAKWRRFINERKACDTMERHDSTQ